MFDPCHGCQICGNQCPEPAAEKGRVRRVVLAVRRQALGDTCVTSQPLETHVSWCPVETRISACDREENLVFLGFIPVLDAAALKTVRPIAPNATRSDEQVA